MHRKEVGDDKPTLPLRATAIVLGVWMLGLGVLAFVVVPLIFATCAAPSL